MNILILFLLHLKSSQEKPSSVLLVGGSGGTNGSEHRQSGSFSRTSSATSSIRRRSLSLSRVPPFQVDDDIESETVSEAGDIGDRALHSNRYSESGSLRFSFDHGSENGLVVSIPEDTQSRSHNYAPGASNAIPSISALPEEIISPLPTDAMVQPEDKIQVSFRLIILIVYNRNLQILSRRLVACFVDDVM